MRFSADMSSDLGLSQSIQSEKFIHNNLVTGFRCEYMLLADNVVSAFFENEPDEDDVKKSLMLFERIVSLVKSHGIPPVFYYILNTGNKINLSLGSRRRVIDIYEHYVRKGTICFLAIVSDSYIGRIVGRVLLLRLRSKASIRFFKSQEEALAYMIANHSASAQPFINFGSPAVRDRPASISYLNFEGKPLQVLYKKHWVVRKNTGEDVIVIKLIAQSIIYIEVKLHPSVQDIKDSFQVLKEVIKSGGLETYDLVYSGLGYKRLSLPNRKTVLELNQEVKQYWNHYYMMLNGLGHIVFKAYAYIEPTIYKNTTLVNSLNEALQLIHKYKSDPLEAYQTGTFQNTQKWEPSLIEYASPEQLRIIVRQLVHENDHLKQLQSSRIEQLFEVLSRITWDDNFKPVPLEVDEQDNFADLFNAIMLLQHDVLDIIGDLKSANKKLEEQVALRTRELAGKESKLRSILDNNDALIWLVDKNYLLLECNSLFRKRYEELYGYEPQLGFPLFPQVPHSFDHKIWDLRYKETLQGQGNTYTDVITFRQQQTFLEISMQPIKTKDGIQGVATFAKDISKQIGATLILERQYEALKKVNEELDKFVYSASHDLRSPLSSIAGLINLAKYEANPPLTSQYLNMMGNCVRKMNELMSDILELSQNARSPVVKKQIMLRTLVDTLFADIAYWDEASNVEFQNNIPADAQLLTDEKRLKIVLNNLISNAIKYKKPQPGAYVSVALELKPSRRVAIVVSDNGQGIAPEHQSKVFDMFYRGTDHNHGSGLGLYIVRESVEKMGGSIRLHSEYGEGSHFILTLPQDDVSQAE